MILSRSGKPVAKIVPYGGVAETRLPGSMEDEIWIAPEFGQLPDDIAEAFGFLEPRN